ncbi:MAG: hypothetical protein M0R74_15635 [Dehalococcoidia bacterium]|nr:hypothetical protein [Dehalococcoidia bacterium]
MSYPHDDEDVIRLGADDDGQFDDDEPDLGPDERDADLLDGSWEQRYYAGQQRRFDWNTIFVGLALLALLGMIIPALLTVLN